MLKFPRLCSVILLASILAGCSIPRPLARQGCNFKATPLRASTIDPHPIWQAEINGAPSRVEPGSFAEALRAAAKRRPAQPELFESSPNTHDQYLALSGGSQHGAFGAGFFYGLAAKGVVPTYKVVTGVSTGALQSTFLFLANQPTGGGNYSWVDGPLKGDVQPGVSNVGDLVLAYSIAREGDILKPSGGGGIFGAIRTGSTDNFVPLRARLAALITPQLLREVALQSQKGRSLFVGVGNVDDGIGYGIDLTALAERVLSPSADVSMIQGCYIDALLASSSVAPGVPPISLQLAGPDSANPDMFVDGGTRNGVFIEQVIAGLADRTANAKLTVIVNGGLYQDPWLVKGARIQKWSALTLALREIDMLENQVYRFSVARAEEFGVANGGLLMAFISTENLMPGAEQPEKHMFRGKDCAEWSVEDSKAGAVQFHPNYMACISDYGTQRGKGELGGTWNRNIPQALAMPVTR